MLVTVDSIQGVLRTMVAESLDILAIQETAAREERITTEVIVVDGHKRSYTLHIFPGKDQPNSVFRKHGVGFVYRSDPQCTVEEVKTQKTQHVSSLNSGTESSTRR